MDNIARIRRALDAPKLFARGANRFFHRRGGLRAENTGGIDVFEEDWDTLLLLDACRYDMFEHATHIEGSLTAEESKGSSTAEWLSANFDGRDLSDTVYVTANPQLERNREGWDVNLYEIINVWLDEGWDAETGTVLPETMNEAVTEVLERFPNKRLVTHYMQPHYPFVVADTEFDTGHLSSIENETDSPTGENVWNRKFTGNLDVPREELWRLYTENLEYVLDHVRELLEAIDGKTVITSDHGNFVGERASPIPIREYGHPRGIYDEPLTLVPWLEQTTGDRRRIVASTPTSPESTADEGVVADRLRELGYRT